jgi:chemotaxis protein MotB
MRFRTIVIALTAPLLFGGCVSSGVHTETLAELDQVRSAAEAQKKQATAEIDKLRADNGRLTQEIAKLQQQVADETAGREQETAKLRDLTVEHQAATAKLSEATDELARLKQRADELVSAQESTTAQLTAANSELEATKQRVEAATAELNAGKQRVEELTVALAASTQEAAELKDASEAASQDARKQHDALQQAEEALEKLRQEQQTLMAQLQQQHTDNQQEIQRLTQAQADLTKSLQSEIANGEIRIQQVADRLTINMVDRILFDSGQGHVKPAGLKVLKQVGDVLKDIKDKQIRIEGHTDNVRIGGKLKDRFPTNWELSTTRATSVVRYLVDKGGIDASNISAVGYADMRPIATNDTEEGRSSNRRIEIVLYPKDLKQIVRSAIETSSSTARP